MAYAIARLGDTSDHNGVIITASSDVTADGKGVARQGDMHSCPLPGHGTTPLSHVTNTTAWTVDGRTGINVNDTAACGARMLNCSPTVSVS